MYSKTIIFILLLSHFGGLTAQECDFSISGEIFDSNTGKPIVDANIFLELEERGATSDENGKFLIDNLCPQEYHLMVSHVGCESKRYYLNIEKDTSIYILLDHSNHLLNGITINGSTTPKITQDIENLKAQSITDNISENLTEQLEKLAGVSALKNGSALSKPIVQGLYGNRLTILNNGITQSGQQWGNDHSPEIDPLSSNEISVLKGVSAIEYLGSNLGSIVLVQPNKISNDPHLHGRAIYFHETNGRGNGSNLQLSKKSKLFSWQVGGTLKKSGDKSTPNYYLNNTGTEEANFSLQLEKSVNEALILNLYFSSYNSSIGILRGSHIGNLTDLEEAINREIPFYTEEDFSYDIDAPRQQVNHHLAKAEIKYFLSNSQWLDIKYAFQFNKRQEYDVRRSGRIDTPSLGLNQSSHFVEGKYIGEYYNGIALKLGTQFNYIDNTNDPETGILPLIPDYRSYEGGFFAILQKKYTKSMIEIGSRYDHIYRDVATISNTTPRAIIRYKNNYGGLSSSLGYNYYFNHHFTLSLNAGYAIRQPAINELYSGGLHQGVSGIELGDHTLKKERSIKSSISLLSKINEKIDIKSLFYYQSISDYIYLNPTGTELLTIRGAFPVFEYTQTDASISGLDLTINTEISQSIAASIAYSYIRGQNLTEDAPLINIPATNISASVNYHVNSSVSVGSKKIENILFQVNGKQVLKKTDDLIAYEYVSPPDGYFLLGLKASAEIQLKKTRLRLVLKSENITNEVYRDYLNRQRYFADDLGRNLSASIKIEF